MPMNCVRRWVAIGLAALAAPAMASITFEKTLVAESPAAFDKGVDFPLLGLNKDKPTFVSARVFKWTQRPDNMYVLAPTQDFTVYPELVRMAADTRKVVRIKATATLPRGGEGHYRIILREFDRADGTDNPPEENTAAMAVVVKPEASVPMIVRGPANLARLPMQISGARPAPPVTTKKGALPPANLMLLTLFNPGQVYQRVVAVGVNAAPGKAQSTLAYVLPGQSVDVPMVIKHGDKVDVQYVIGPDAKVDMVKGGDDRKTVSFVAP